jgi:hypothetical protein
MTGGHVEQDVYEKTNISPYISNQGISPHKPGMNKTMPRGFMSPTNNLANSGSKKVAGVHQDK